MYLSATIKSKFSVAVSLYCLLLASAAMALTPQKISVIAVEYPPFITNNNKDFGLTFTKLSSVIAPHGYSAQPQFLPPARASMIVDNTTNWCLSFIGPTQPKDNVQAIIFDSGSIPFHFYRTKAPSNQEFQWQHLNELSGKSLGILRFNDYGKLSIRFKRAGIELYRIETVGSAFRMLAKNRIDMVMADRYSAEYYFSQFNIDPQTMQRSTNILFEAKHQLWFNLHCKNAQTLYQRMKK